MHKYLLSILLLSLTVISFAQDSTEKMTATLKISDHGAYRDFEKHACFFRINGKEFEYKDGDIAFPVNEDNTVDTIYYRSSISNPYIIFTLCKFRSNQFYDMHYNTCDNSIKLASSDTILGEASVRIIIRNYNGNAKNEGYIECAGKLKWKTEGDYIKNKKGVRLKNDILSEPIILINDCLTAYCPGEPVFFEIRQKITSNKYGSIRIIGFKPLHRNKEKLILEYDFATQKSKLYLE